jgi:hypothetical protein
MRSPHLTAPHQLWAHSMALLMGKCWFKRQVCTTTHVLLCSAPSQHTLLSCMPWLQGWQ